MILRSRKILKQLLYIPSLLLQEVDVHAQNSVSLEILKVNSKGITNMKNLNGDRLRKVFKNIGACVEISLIVASCLIINYRVIMSSYNRLVTFHHPVDIDTAYSDDSNTEEINCWCL